MNGKCLEEHKSKPFRKQTSARLKRAVCLDALNCLDNGLVELIEPLQVWLSYGMIIVEIIVEMVLLNNSKKVYLIGISALYHILTIWWCLWHWPTIPLLKYFILSPVVRTSYSRDSLSGLVPEGVFCNRSSRTTFFLRIFHFRAAL